MCKSKPPASRVTITHAHEQHSVCVCVEMAWQRSQHSTKLNTYEKDTKLQKKQQQQIPQTANVYTMYDKQ